MTVFSRISICFRILSLKTKDNSASSWLFYFVSYFLARYKNEKNSDTVSVFYRQESVSSYPKGPPWGMPCPMTTSVEYLTNVSISDPQDQDNDYCQYVFSDLAFATSDETGRRKQDKGVNWGKEINDGRRNSRQEWQPRRLSVQGCVDDSHSDPPHSLSALFAKR